MSCKWFIGPKETKTRLTGKCWHVWDTTGFALSLLDLLSTLFPLCSQFDIFSQELTHKIFWAAKHPLYSLTKHFWKHSTFENQFIIQNQHSAFQIDIFGQEYVSVKTFKTRIWMCRGTIKIHPSLKESYFVGKCGYTSGRWEMHCRTGRLQLFQHPRYHHLTDFRLYTTVCILVRVQSKDLLHLLHYQKCLSSLKSTDITLSYVIFLRDKNLNREESFF